MGLIGWILLGAFLTACVYLLRFLLAVPLILVLRLFGQSQQAAVDKGQAVVGTIGSAIWIFLTVALFIWTWPMYSGAFGVIFENLWYLIKLLPELLFAALGCVLHLSC